VAPWGHSRLDRTVFATARRLGCGLLSVYRGGALELPYLYKTEKIRQH
jgi:hypothetical protein